MLLKIDEDGIPLDCPSAKDLRIAAAYIRSLFPLQDFKTLVEAQQYQAAHELAGIHEGAKSLEELADALDERNSPTRL